MCSQKDQTSESMRENGKDGRFELMKSLRQNWRRMTSTVTGLVTTSQVVAWHVVRIRKWRVVASPQTRVKCRQSQCGFVENPSSILAKEITCVLLCRLISNNMIIHMKFWNDIIIFSKKYDIYMSQILAFISFNLESDITLYCLYYLHVFIILNSIIMFQCVILLYHVTNSTT